MSTPSLALPTMSQPVSTRPSPWHTRLAPGWLRFQRGLGLGALASGLVAAGFTGLEAQSGLGTAVDVLVLALLGFALVSLGEGVTLLVAGLLVRLVRLGVRLAGRGRAMPLVLPASPLDPKQLGRLLGAVFLAGCDRWFPFPPFSGITLSAVLEAYMPFIWLGGGLLALAWPLGERWPAPRNRAQAAGLAGAVILLAGPLAWAAVPGTTAGLARAELLSAEDVATLALENPGLAGPLAVEALTYGSGADRRPEFGRDAVLVTPTVDGYDIFAGPGGPLGSFQNWFWQFDMHALPLNGRVWYPAAGSDPLPLVLIVHGNHAAGDYSDPGYAYLGEHLASRGYIAVSVDENFLNGGWLGPINGEMPMRAWLLLKHLQQWRAWNDTPGNPFYGRVDLDRVGLVGHSRGGEAAVHAAELNEYAHSPVSSVDGPEAFGFGIRGVVALGPCDGQYQPAGRRVTLRNASYLLINGGHDGDTHTPYGMQQFNRVTWDENPDGFKAFVYLYRANHGQFNTVWGDADVGVVKSTLLNRAPYLSAAEQRQAGQVLITAFLEAAVRGQDGYRAVFYQPDAARAWLPADLNVTQYQDASFVPLATFDAGQPVAEFEAVGLTWQKVPLMLRDGETPQRNTALRLAWAGAGEAALRLDVPGGTRADDALMLDVGVLDDLPGPAAVWVEVVDAAGHRVRLPLTRFGALHPRLPVQVMKWAWLSELMDLDRKTVRTSEDLLQTYALPLAAFAEAEAAFDAAQLAEVAVVFEADGAGGVWVDQIGLMARR